MSKLYKIVVYVPAESADRMRTVLGEAGTGKVGNYDFTSFSVKGTGRFRALPGAHPRIGQVGKNEQVEEERIETTVEEEILTQVVSKIKVNHPYEEPVIDVYELRG